MAHVLVLGSATLKSDIISAHNITTIVFLPLHLKNLERHKTCWRNKLN